MKFSILIILCITLWGCTKTEKNYQTEYEITKNQNERLKKENDKLKDSIKKIAPKETTVKSGAKELSEYRYLVGKTVEEITRLFGQADNIDESSWGLTYLYYYDKVKSRYSSKVQMLVLYFKNNKCVDIKAN